jgi:tetratricopeptide (TPR) repeat protein
MAKKNQTPQTNTVQAAISPSMPWWQNKFYISILIIALSFMLYSNTLSHQFTLDDPIVLTENMFTVKGFSGIKDIWTHDSFFGYFKSEEKIQLVAGGRYRPLTPTMFAIGWQLFGNSPYWGHFLNILCYALTCILLYVVLLRLLKNTEYRHVVAVATTFLFLTHPLHTEAIANIKGLDEIMTLMGSLAAVHFSFKAFDRQENGQRANIIAAIIFFLALTAKENAIMFVFILPLMYYFFTDAPFGKIWKQTLYFIIPAVVFVFIRGAIIGWKFQTNLGELMNNPFIKIVDGKYILFTTAERLATVMFTLGKYIILLFLPHPLTHDYYPRQIEMKGFGDWQVLLSLAAYAGLVFLFIKSLKTKNIIGFGIAFYLITLAIVANIFFPIGTNMGERFLFMPSIGFCLIIAYFGYTLLKKMPSTVGLAALALVLGLYSFKTISRNPAWKDNYTLFLSDINSSPNSAKLRNALGGETIAQAQKEKDPKKQTAMFDEAMTHLQKAVEIHPRFKNAYLLMGNSYNYKKDFEKAIENYKKCLEIEPDDKDAKHNLSITYRYYGIYYLEQKKDIPNAIRCLEEVYKYKPDDIESIRMLGLAAGLKGDHSKAIEHLTKVIQKLPNDAKAYYDLSIAYASLNNVQKSAEMRQKAAALNPQFK